MKHTILDADGTVTRLIEWDGNAELSLPDGHSVRRYQSGDYVPVPERQGPTPRELYEAAGTTQAKLDVIAQRLGLKE